MSLIEFAKQIDAQDGAECAAFRCAVLEATRSMGNQAADLVDCITECLGFMELAAIVGEDPDPYREKLIDAVGQIRPILH